MHVPAASLDKSANYALMSSGLIPRPIAWIGTRSTAGVDNLAPFSYFMGVASDPPLVAVSIARGRKGALKDTAHNLLSTRICTISIVTRPHLEAMHRSSAPFPPDRSEFEALGLQAVDAKLVAAPRVAGAPFAMECRLHQAQDLGSTHLMLLRVVGYEVEEGRLVDGRLRYEGLEPVGRLGGEYALTGEVIHLPPPKVD